MANIGDRVQALSPKLGQPPREGVVTGVSGRLRRVRWSSGEESTIVPAVGSVTRHSKGQGTFRKERARSDDRGAT